MVDPAAGASAVGARADGVRADGASGVDRLIFALDYPSLEPARAAAEQLRGEVGVVKVGLELFCRYGADALVCGPAAEAPVFLDLKLHDIPATVGSAVTSVVARSEERVRFVTVHASGGTAMLRAAVEAAGDAVRIVAVTVLTSLDRDDLAAMGVAADPARQVERLARIAFDAGVLDFVCSPAEAAVVRGALGASVNIITPGVRPLGADHQDQKRVTTPAQAIAGGANMLVVGRPIREAPDPVTAARAIAGEIASALEGQS